MWPWNTRKELVVYKVEALKEMNAEEALKEMIKKMNTEESLKEMINKMNAEVASKKKALWRRMLAPIHGKDPEESSTVWQDSS
ncbi:UNVERIFIED_CONTAM: hypothetical protein Sangu_1184800 [Sesamum angustifolium]|uniref:Uncharacterized protein n=1 Tax=Sesamum angustifolium TaxID=2727405 RepID=A0AAW2NHC4_9LAMI